MGWVINLAYVNYPTDGNRNLQLSLDCFCTKLSVANKFLACRGFHLRGNLISLVHPARASYQPAKHCVLLHAGCQTPAPCLAACTSSSTANPGSWGWAQRGPAVWGRESWCGAAARKSALPPSRAHKPRCRQTAAGLDFLLHNLCANYKSLFCRLLCLGPPSF